MEDGGGKEYQAARADLSGYIKGNVEIWTGISIPIPTITNASVKLWAGADCAVIPRGRPPNARLPVLYN